MFLETFADRAIDVPFVELGRSWDGWDCWGLVRQAYFDVYDVDLPTFTEYESTKRRDELMKLIRISNDGLFELIDESVMTTGDVVLLKMLGRPCHIGLMLNNTKVLHTEAKCGTVIEDINAAPWRGNGYDKVEGFYRYIAG